MLHHDDYADHSTDVPRGRRWAQHRFCATGHPVSVQRTGQVESTVQLSRGSPGRGGAGTDVRGRK